MNIGKNHIVAGFVGICLVALVIYGISQQLRFTDCDRISSDAIDTAYNFLNKKGTATESQLNTVPQKLNVTRSCVSKKLLEKKGVYIKNCGNWECRYSIIEADNQ